MARSELQKKVGEALEVFGLFDIYSEDATLATRNQPRWKQRFTNALSYLKDEDRECVKAIGKAPDAPKWQRGVHYELTERGFSLISDIELHLEPSHKGLPISKNGNGHCYLYRVSEFTKGLDAHGDEICPNELKSAEIPPELAGRPARPKYKILAFCRSVI